MHCRTLSLGKGVVLVANVGGWVYILTIMPIYITLRKFYLGTYLKSI